MVYLPTMLLLQTWMEGKISGTPRSGASPRSILPELFAAPTSH